MGFPRQESWSGLPFPPPGNLPNSGMEPVSPALAGRFFTTEPPGKRLLPSCSDFRTTLQGSLASRAPCGISGASDAIMLHAIQFLLCPSCRLYPLTDAVLRVFLHQLCTCKSLSRAQFPGGTPPGQHPGRNSHQILTRPEGTFTYVRDHGSPEKFHHRSLVCVVREDTVWHQMQESVGKGRVFGRETPAVAKGRPL